MRRYPRLKDPCLRDLKQCCNFANVESTCTDADSPSNAGFKNVDGACDAAQCLTVTGVTNAASICTASGTCDFTYNAEIKKVNEGCVCDVMQCPSFANSASSRNSVGTCDLTCDPIDFAYNKGSGESTVDASECLVVIKSASICLSTGTCDSTCKSDFVKSKGKCAPISSLSISLPSPMRQGERKTPASSSTFVKGNRSILQLGSPRFDSTRYVAGGFQGSARTCTVVPGDSHVTASGGEQKGAHDVPAGRPACSPLPPHSHLEPTMFKKFHPKEDVASSTAIKSSIQRQHRAKLLSQITYLSLPALPPPASTGLDSDDDSEVEEQLLSSAKGRNKGAAKDKRKAAEAQASGGGKGKGGKGGRGAKAVQEDEQPAAEEGATGTQQDGGDVLTVLDVLWPKKSQITLVKWSVQLTASSGHSPTSELIVLRPLYSREHISILALNGEPLFFQHFDGPYYPTLKVLHKYPEMLPKVGVDRGAIKFVLSGANIMCPGLTSPTAFLPPSEANIPVGHPVAVHAYGKEEALAIGSTAMSTDDIRSINKNIGVENVTYLGDDLWKVDKL
ncbi:BZ3500_MvSof-1268-A1-R1_Chr1-1g00921 [Microbotryum saponariae]|uniref:BZ3500_MvSof-1268-A1-R1_Chr1-1g00921 protein n=1 Tax=Microbotryum saponariae TaxID=289078 RepID=A0A2X0KHU1_9BASI|nr:BZ3500_MvSof-1268-A1-R1_Chr1-1g00921 [Microbotryum saponariae]SCZ92939.1 BZ3501_MvSof-1269-A2-R1_Chr1-1g00518 [Microbotryum saponariae]